MIITLTDWGANGVDWDPWGASTCRFHGKFGKVSIYTISIGIVLISRSTSTWTMREMRRCRCQGDDKDAGDDDAGDDVTMTMTVPW